MMAEPKDSGTVRVAADLLEKIRFICYRRKKGGRHLKASEYVDHLVRRAVEADYAKELTAFTAEQNEKK